MPSAVAKKAEFFAICPQPRSPISKTSQFCSAVNKRKETRDGGELERVGTLTAIELCKECWFILDERAGGITDEKLSKLFYKGIYFTMWRSVELGLVVLSTTPQNAIKDAEKPLQLSKELTGIYFHDSKYAQAKLLSEKALFNQ